VHRDELKSCYEAAADEYNDASVGRDLLSAIYSSLLSRSHVSVISVALTH